MLRGTGNKHVVRVRFSGERTYLHDYTFSISIDAVISLVTVSKLTKMEVEANCYCPGKGTSLI